MRLLTNDFITISIKYANYQLHASTTLCKFLCSSWKSVVVHTCIFLFWHWDVPKIGTAIFYPWKCGFSFNQVLHTLQQDKLFTNTSFHHNLDILHVQLLLFFFSSSSLFSPNTPRYVFHPLKSHLQAMGPAPHQDPTRIVRLKVWTKRNLHQRSTSGPQTWSTLSQLLGQNHI